MMAVTALIVAVSTGTALSLHAQTTSGTTGSSGTNGTTGTNTTYGTNGTTGTSGMTGTSGTSGTSGTTGTNSNTGTSGTTGTSGMTGSTGTGNTGSTSGTSGMTGSSNSSTGTTGSSGMTGSSATSGSTGTSGSMPILYDQNGNQVNATNGSIPAGYYYLNAPQSQGGHQVEYYGNGTYYDPTTQTYGGSINSNSSTGTSNSSSVTPGAPNTGEGGMAAYNWLILGLSAAVFLGSVAFVATRAIIA